MTRPASPRALATLYRNYSTGRVSRREFLRQAAALGAVGAPLLVLGCGGGAAPTDAAGGAAPALDLAEWSYFWLGVQGRVFDRGTVVDGTQMYVEYWTPAQVRHPYPMVLVHGGGGQGLDWLGRPDGGPGWVTYLLQEGYRVYLVDRPGHGRSPYHPELHRPFGARATTYEGGLQDRFAVPALAEEPYGPQALTHTRWTGTTGQVGDPALDQLVTGQGGAFLDAATSHAIWAERGGALLDRIGPSVVMCHSAGGPAGWLFANARPGMVRAVVGVEPAGPPFGGNQWGVTASPLEYDPPASEPSELVTVEVPAADGRDAYQLLAEPRRLVHLQDLPIAVVTAPASYHWPYDMGTVAFLRQCGCAVEHLELENFGITGNGHLMMCESNNREVLDVILQWLQQNVTDVAGPDAVAVAQPAPAAAGVSTALRLADHGYFWAGVERRQMDYGTIPGAAMFVQYLVPSEVRHELPIVLVHGGTGQMLHYMGEGGGVAGWAHYYVQAGYRVYLVDRPGHGRCVYHPDAHGEIMPTNTYEQILPDIERAVAGGRWPGPGGMTDPVFQQFMASQNGMSADIPRQHASWARCGADLLDRIGPAIIQAHSFGGPFGWLVADQRPDLVRAIVVFESAGSPFEGFLPWGVAASPLAYDPPAASPEELATEAVAAAGDMPAYTRQAGEARRLVNLQNVPTLFFTADASGRTAGPAFVEVLRQAGVPAEHLHLRDRGITGNGHFAMIETNRQDVFEVVRGWIEQTVPPTV
jgi:pimeloyl-ACP methyl ester carboxylesterase